MKAVILAGGSGKRLYPFSQDLPKPLFPILGKPLLTHHLEALQDLVEEVIIIVSCKKEMIMQKYGHEFKGIKITYVDQKERLGTAHALLKAEPYIAQETFLSLYGDDLYSREDIKSMLGFKHCLLAAYKENPSAFGVIVGKEGTVEKIVEKPKEFISNLVNTGLYLLPKRVFKLLKEVKISQRGEYEVTDAISDLAKEKIFNYHQVKEYWLPVGYPWHILEATKTLLQKEKKSKVLGQGTTLDPTCVCEGFVVIGKNTIVHDEVKLKNVVIGDNCIIEKGCIIQDSVIGDNVQIEKGITIHNTNEDNSVVIVKQEERRTSSHKKQLGAFVANNCKITKDLFAGECRVNDY